MKIFLSHINEEQQLAFVLKEWIESSFPDIVEAFVSSDIRDLAAGDRWLLEIDSALEDAQAFIVLCSPMSIARPWINFETGCAWIKRVPVLPVCHSGQLRSALPSPLSEFQALETNDSDFVEDLVMSLVKHLSLSKVPRIDGESMRSDIWKAINKIQRPDPSEPSEGSLGTGLDEVTIDVLKKLADFGERGLTLEELARDFGLKVAKMEYYLDNLVGIHYIRKTPSMVSASSRYTVRPEGRRFLVERGLL